MMIEILPSIFFDPSKTWYEQPPELIELASTVMQEDPIDSQAEIGAINSRNLWKEWEVQTDLGVFSMQVDAHYLYNVDSNSFMSKVKHDTVNVIKLS